MARFDTIVIGLGGMGSATVCELARRGQRVLGIEQFDLGHARGSSHGQSRIIRQAYFEHPDYVPLLQAAYTGWQRLAETTDLEIINLCGLVMAGKDTDAVIRGTREAAAQHGLPLEVGVASDVAERYPGLHFGDGSTVLFDPIGGYLRVENCVQAHLDESRRLGATLHAQEFTQWWDASAKGVRVVTDRASYDAKGLVICAGPWASQAVASLDLPLSVHRMVTAWFPTTRPAYARANGAPVFACQSEHGFFYSIPALDDRGVKVAGHEPGPRVSDPAEVDRNVTTEDLAPIRQFTKRHMPDLPDEPGDSNVCLYTMTPDGHFILDRHPKHDNVFFGAGFSGHGFKFCPAIGTLLADMVTGDTLSLPADFLSLGRFHENPSA